MDLNKTGKEKQFGAILHIIPSYRINLLKNAFMKAKNQEQHA